MQQLVALTPQELVPAQRSLIEWCQARIHACAADLREARHNLSATKRLMLGSPKAWQRVVKQIEARMVYYAKIMMAVRAGYLVIPNLPATVLAVRVGRAAPHSVTATYPNSINTAKAEMLPPGTGRYVDETLPHRDMSYTTNPTPQHAQGQHVRLARVDSYDEHVDFPVALVKPAVLEAVEHAMSLKIFDRIALVDGGYTRPTLSRSRRQIKADPIVIGHVLDGSVKHYGERYLTFFVAWWLDPETV